MNEIKEKYIKKIRKLIKKNTKLIYDIQRSMQWGYETKVDMSMKTTSLYSDFRDDEISVSEMREKCFVDEILRQCVRLINLYLNNPSNLKLTKEPKVYYLKGEDIIFSFSDYMIFINFKNARNISYEIYFEDNDIMKEIDKDLFKEYKELYKKLSVEHFERVQEQVRQKMH